MPDCVTFTKQRDNIVNAKMAALQKAADDTIVDIIGLKSNIRTEYLTNSKIRNRALDSYDKLYNAMMDHVLRNFQVLDDKYDLNMFKNSINDYIQHQFKDVGIFTDKRSMAIEPRRMIAASKLIRNLLNMQRTRWGKKLNVFERAFMPVTMFALRSDPFGYIYNFIRKATSVIEDSRTRYTRYNQQYNEYVSDFANSISNHLAAIKGVYGPEWVMDGLDDVNDNMNQAYRFLGTVKHKGQLMHKVIPMDRVDDDNTPEYIPTDRISQAVIRDKIIDKYTNEFVNDILHGQTRYVQWTNEPIVKAHEQEISNLMSELWWREKNIDDEQEKKMGHPKIQTIKHGDTLYQYVMIRENAASLRQKITEELGELAEQQSNLLKSKDRRSKYRLEEVNRRRERLNKYLEALTRRFDREVHYAYLISHKAGDGVPVYYYSRFGKTRPAKVDVSVDTVKRQTFRDGFYKAPHYKTYQRAIKNYAEGELSDSRLRGWNFGTDSKQAYLPQPHPSVVSILKGDLSRRISGEERIKYRSLWSTVAGIRQLYEQVGDDIAIAAQKELDKINAWFSKDKSGKIKINETLKSILGEGDAKEVLNALDRIFQISNRLWVDDKGNISTPNSFFIKKTGMYAPIIYEDGTVDSMLEDAVRDINLEIDSRENSENPDEEFLDRLRLKRDALLLAQSRRNNDEDRQADLSAKLGLDNIRYRSREIIGERNVFTKHREEWTNPALRRKDSRVHSDYLSKVYYSIQKNNLMVQMLDTIDKVSRSQGDPIAAREMVEWMVNRTKVAFHDPLAKGGIGKLDYSYKRLAEVFNKTPGMGKNWTPDRVQKWLTHSRSLFSAALLGTAGAMNNRTQIVNEVIGFGWDAVGEATRILSGSDPKELRKWEAIIDNAGTDEVTNMFMDFMLYGGDVNFADAGMVDVPGLPVQIPKPALYSFFSLAKKGRQSFVKNGVPEFDANLRKIEKQRIDSINNKRRKLKIREETLRANLKGRDRAKFEKMMFDLNVEKKRLTSQAERRKIEELRANFFDLIMTDKKDANRKALESKFRRIMGEVSENRLKRMVSWKLTWFPSAAKPLNQFFTFTEGERSMRKQSVIINLLAAQRAGHLGELTRTKDVNYTDEKGRPQVAEGVPEVLLSDKAIRIARNGVNNTMFGMSTLHQGDAFIGAGAQLGLYKTYPIQQMIHDFRIFQSFLAGSSNRMEHVTRLTNAFWELSKIKARGGKYNPESTGIDHEAVKVLRLIATRAAMTGISIAVESLRWTRAFFNTPITKQLSTMIRGGENPAMAIAGRLLVNTILFAAMDDDEFAGDNLIFDISRLLLPVFLTLPATLAMEIAGLEI